jgi:hypothetical protein
MEKHVFKVRYGLRIDGQPPILKVSNRDLSIVFDTELTSEIAAMFDSDEYCIFINGLFDPNDGMIYLKDQVKDGETW